MSGASEKVLGNQAGGLTDEKLEAVPDDHSESDEESDEESEEESENEPGFDSYWSEFQPILARPGFFSCSFLIIFLLFLCLF